MSYVRCVCCVPCSCPSEVLFQRLDDGLTRQQLQQLQQQEDQQQPPQQLLQLGSDNTVKAVGYDYLLSVSPGKQTAQQPSSD